MSTLSKPADKSLNLTFYSSGTNDTRIIVKNLDGVIVYEEMRTLALGDNNIQLQTESFENGVYNVQIINSERSVTIKFSISH